VIRFIANTASTITWKIALVTLCMGDIHTYPERSSLDVLFDGVHQADFYINTLRASSDKIWAKWTPKRSIKLIRIDAYASTAPDANATIRLTNGVNNVDVTINSGQNLGSNTTTVQEFNGGTELTLKVPANSVGTGGECNYVLQYRMHVT
jgi:hypothetical protein